MLTDEDLDTELLQRLIRANRRRNDIMHEYDIETKKDDAKDILELIDGFNITLCDKLFTSMS